MSDEVMHHWQRLSGSTFKWCARCGALKDDRAKTFCPPGGTWSETVPRCNSCACTICGAQHDGTFPHTDKMGTFGSRGSRG